MTTKRLYGTLRRSMTGNLSAGELGRRVWKELQKDMVPGRAAELAYYFTMAFFPLLICLITLLALIPGTEDFLFGYLDPLLPKEAAGMVHGWVSTIFQYGSGGLLSFSLLFTLWSASSGVVALIDVFNVAYEVKEGRPFWKSRLVAFALTLGLALLVLGGAALFIAGAFVLDWLAGLFNLSQWMQILTKAVNYVVGLSMLFLGISLLHYFGPNLNQRWKFFTPGALVSVAGILGASYLFSLYLRFAPSYSAVYGGLGAIVILMLWLYLISLILVVGAEINDEVRKAAGERLVERE